MNVFIKVLVLSLILTVNPAFAKTIFVGGAGEVKSEPDIVSFRVEVWSKASSAQQAQNLLTSEFQRLKKIFDSGKVAKSDLQTENYTVNPEYTFDNKTNQNRLVGFRGTHFLQVTVRDIPVAMKMLDNLVGGNKGQDVGCNVNSISWDSSRKSDMEMEALGLAVADARKRADIIAKASGLKIKSVAKISHNANSDYSPRPMYAAEMNFKAGGAPDLAGGQVKMSSSVQVEFDAE